MADAVTHRPPRLIDRLWAILRHPATAAAVTLLLLLLVISSFVLPQAPGQTQGDPAAAQRWVNAESDRWGGLVGPALRALGLFTVSTSPLFLFSLALAALVASIRLADAIQRALLPGRLRARLRAPSNGEAANLPSPDALERSRSAWPSPPTQAIDALRARLTAAIAVPEEDGTIPHPNAGPGAGAAPGDGAASPLDAAVGKGAADGEDAPAANVTATTVGVEDVPPETRLLSMRHMGYSWVRMLLPLGILLLLAGLWADALWGWSLRTPALAPGDAYVWSPRAVTISYGSTAMEGAASPETLETRVGEETVRLPAVAGGGALAGNRIAVHEAAPALWVSTEQPLLQQPGQLDTRAHLGMTFLQPGNEQVVVLPGSGAGLRVIRLGSVEPGFLVEIFAVDAEQPVQRRQITATETITLPLAGEVVSLRLQPATSFTVDVRHSPSGWLLAPALALLIAGCAGYLVRPRFAFVQVQPWPRERAAVTLQTNARALVDAITAIEPANPEEAAPGPA